MKGNLIHRVKFYSDSPKGINLKFCYRVANKAEAIQALERFRKKGHSIRAAWYDIIIKGGIRYHNELIFKRSEP